MTRRERWLQLLAAEYALGTLQGKARLRFERWCNSDSEVAHAVHYWEMRLAQFQKNTPVLPSAALWQRIEAQLGREPVIGKTLAPWRWVALAASLMVVALSLRSLLPITAPDQPVASATVPSSQPAFSAYLTTVEQRSRWWVRTDRERRHWMIVALETAAFPGDRDPELWLLAADGRAPISLGILPRKGSRLLPVTDVALLAGAKLAISLEPLGGSTTGAPTGPVLTASALLPGA